MKPTTQEEFERVTPLMPGVVAMSAMGVVDSLSGEQWEWFVRFCDTYVRWLHANDKTWRKKVEGPDGGLDWCYTYVGHWLSAYLRDPGLFQSNHQIEALEEKPS